MNTYHEHNSNSSSNSGSQKNASMTKTIIGAIAAIALIIFAITAQSNATPAGVANIEVPPITQADHVRGDLSAPVQVIEYSDLECPFCKDFHATMIDVFAKYGADNKIVWAYRHYPLEQLHQQAFTEALASECVAKEGGEAAFWKFVDNVFAVTKSNDGLDLKTLPTLAEAAGAPKLKFNTCMASKATEALVREDMQSGSKAGIKGTPFSIVISPAGNKYTIEGAYPIAQVEATIEKALADK